MFRGLSNTTKLISCRTNLRSTPTRFFFDDPEPEEPKRTILYHTHVKAGGKMDLFHDYLLPIQYAENLTESHRHVRASAGLFDVSHMGQLQIFGEHREAFLERITVADVKMQPEYTTKLTVMTNQDGGTIDDCMITKKPDHLYLVVNAGCKEKDILHINTEIYKFNQLEKYKSTSPVKLVNMEEQALLALQGPKSAQVLKHFLPEVDFPFVPFLGAFEAVIEGIPLTVTRCGYTGEDGFELSCSNDDAIKLWNLLLSRPEVKPTGLGVRDSLRLEAGLCLYGHELDEETSFIEVGMKWLINSRRQSEGNFIGYHHIMDQLGLGTEPAHNYITKSLCGLEVLEGPPAREGALIYSVDGEQIGHVSSGAPSPTLHMKKIALGFVPLSYNLIGNSLDIEIRGKKYPAKIIKRPFVLHKYHKVPVIPEDDD